MAQESKDSETSAASKRPKAAAQSAKPAVKAEGAAGKAPKGGNAQTKPKRKATPSVTDGPTCRAEKCKQPVRAKGYCRKHFMAWRRGEAGDHHRYKVCSKEACRKPRTKGGLCDEHAGVATPAAEGSTPAA